MNKKYFYWAVFSMAVVSSYHRHFLIEEIPISEDLVAEWCYISSLTSTQEMVELRHVRSGRKSVLYRGAGVCKVEYHNNALSVYTEGSAYVEFNPQNEYQLNVLLDTACNSKYLYVDKP